MLSLNQNCIDILLQTGFDLKNQHENCIFHTDDGILLDWRGGKRLLCVTPLVRASVSIPEGTINMPADLLIKVLFLTDLIDLPMYTTLLVVIQRGVQ